ncbi:MAG: orotate phosphoribosyltransferase [Candidatus Nitrosocosmicus sp.]|nr:orotate phosphoribosyltransferase [Candidatus Nitrosocosmicus sp.]
MNRPINSKYKDALFELIKDKGIVIKDVVLSSGETSKYYYDLKRVVLTPTGSDLIGKLLLQEVLQFEDVKSIGGLEVGATLIAPLITLKSSESQLLDAFFVRKSAKKHGLEKEIEGNLIDPAVIVDDVITTGKSVLQTLDKIKQENTKVNGIVCIIDREEGAKELFDKRGVPFISLFKHSDFKDYINSRLNLQNPDVEVSYQ